MAIAKLFRNRGFLAAAGAGMVVYFVLLAFFLNWLLRAAPIPASSNSIPAEFHHGVPLLTLGRQGEVLAPGRSQPLTASEVTRMLPALVHLNRWLAEWHGVPPSKEVIVSAPPEVPYRRVYEMLRLCQAVGFDGHELRAGNAAGVRSHLPRPKKPIQPHRSETEVLEDELMLPVQITVLLRANESGGLAAVVVRSPDGEVAMPDAATLVLYLKQRTDEVRQQDQIDIEADSPLNFGLLAEALAACHQAGFKNLVLALPPEMRPKRRPTLHD